MEVLEIFTREFFLRAVATDARLEASRRDGPNTHGRSRAALSGTHARLGAPPRRFQHTRARPSCTLLRPILRSDGDYANVGSSISRPPRESKACADSEFVHGADAVICPKAIFPNTVSDQTAAAKVHALPTGAGVACFFSTWRRLFRKRAALPFNAPLFVKRVRQAGHDREGVVTGAGVGR